MEHADSNDMTEKIKALAPWFHNLHFEDGSQTAPDHFLGDFPRFKWLQVAPFIPEDSPGCRAWTSAAMRVSTPSSSPAAAPR